MLSNEEVSNIDIQYSAELRDLEEESENTEQKHKLADDILCVVLRKLGAGGVVDAYREVHKWYS